MAQSIDELLSELQRLGENEVCHLHRLLHDYPG